MRTSCNPGSWILVTGSFELIGDNEDEVRDRESQTVVELADILKSFREDPSDPVIGMVKITVEPIRTQR